MPDELGFREGNVLDPLARNRVGIEADEVTGMAGPHGDTDLARLLEAADTGAMTGAGIDNDKRTLGRVDLASVFWQNAQERIVNRTLQVASVQHRLVIKDQNRRLATAMVLERNVAALAHHVPEQNAALTGVNPVVQRLVTGDRLWAHVFPSLNDALPIRRSRSLHRERIGCRRTPQP